MSIKLFRPLLHVFTLCLVIAYTCMPASAQVRQIRKGDKALSVFSFNKAIESYKKALDKKSKKKKAASYRYQALGQLANTYRIIGDYENALQYYEQLVQHPECTPLQKFYYAQMLRTAGRYEEAKKFYEEYARLAPDDPRGKRLADGIDLIPDWMKDSMLVRLKPYSFNTPVSEFSPSYYYGDSAIVFPSARGTGKTDVWSNAPFLDLYISVKTDTGFLSPAPLPGNVNKQYHEGPVTFDSSWTVMYFTRNNYLKRKRKSQEGIMKLKVFKAQLVDGKWKEILDLPFNSDEYSVGHPTLSADGRYLFFASDMPHENAQGGQDLYVVEITDSGFSKPINLGSGVNTRGDEVFPFIHKNGTLYFASDSYEGLGGLDIYSATQKDGVWGNVKHLGYPINSRMDDFGLIYNDNLESGLFSSNRQGGAGSDDIYLFTRKQQVILLGKVVDKKTRDPIGDAMVKLQEKPAGSTDVMPSDKNGAFTFTLLPGKEYSVIAEKYGWFLVNTVEVSTIQATEDTIRVVLEMQRLEVGEVIKLENIYYDYDKYDIRPDAAEELDKFVAFMKRYPGLEVELRSHTDSRGSDNYNKWLSQKRAESAVQYVISRGVEPHRITARGYGESLPVNHCVNGVPCSEEEHQMNRRTEFVVTQQPDGLKVKSSVQP
ncbi:MAG: cell envelope biogenesis protein OmpA [Chitinophagales bacterium]|nr:MAG: cell envelope biogenesis protein OmpA [Chitinophagales bacterium]